MSLYCIITNNDKELDMGQIATTQGWSDFIEWANVQGFFQMAHLSQHGYATKLDVLAQELRQSVEKSPPKNSVLHTAIGIVEICDAFPKAGILLVTDGDGESETFHNPDDDDDFSDYDDDDEEEEDDDED